MWGTRGSLPTPGADTARYGGNTACVEVTAVDDAVAVLDAGTGVRALGQSIDRPVSRVDVLITHLHMDHIIGLGFFAPLFDPACEVHLWGPASATLGLRARLARYLSPPLFPVRIRDLAEPLHMHDVPFGAFEIPGFEVRAELVCHPGPTVGYRLDDGRSVLTYLPDHEPALGSRTFPGSPRWTSGFDLAHGADVLVHDAQYDDAEYAARVGWGHSTIDHALAFARLVDARRLVAFHHDPDHDDATLDALFAGAASGGLDVTVAREGDVFETV